eukprot:scaffold906_cov151-Amphora_coffeaeformis.AAC.2
MPSTAPTPSVPNKRALWHMRRALGRSSSSTSTIALPATLESHFADHGQKKKKILMVPDAPT